MLSVDPGTTKGCAVAYWSERGVLEWTDIVHVPVPSSFPSEICAVEVPQVYAGRYAKDLVDLAFAAGRITANYTNVRKVLPREWAGQVPKAIRHRKLLAKLSDAERAVLEGWSKSQLVDILDAVGIGLYVLNR